MSAHGHVLVVDDELVIRSLLSDMLSEEGFTVATAEDGRRGPECANQGKVDLVISDIQMPVMTGPELVSELREVNPGLPVIVLNSIPGKDVASATADRATACVDKPFDLRELPDAIGRLCEYIFEQADSGLAAGSRQGHTALLY